MGSIFAIAIRRMPKDAADLRDNMAEIVKGRMPRDELRAQLLALVPEVRWNDSLDRATGNFPDGTEIEIVVLEQNGTLSLRPSHHRGKSLEVVLRFFDRSSEWILFDDEQEQWRPPAPRMVTP